MDWNSLIRGFEDYLMLERSLSPHSIDAYVRDIKKVQDFVELKGLDLSPIQIQYQDLENFVVYLYELGVQAKSQARIISGVRAFYKFLLIEDLMQHDPSELLEGPRLGKYLPDTLQSAIKYINYYLPIRNKVTPKPGEEDFMFLNRRGSHLSRIMIFNIVKDAVKAAGIDKVVSPHTFRHSFASHMVDAGADLRSVQDMLGHESITTTEIYTHIDTNYLRDTIMTFHPSNRP